MININTKMTISSLCAVLVGLFANFVIKPKVKRTFPSIDDDSKKFFSKRVINLAASKCGSLEKDNEMTGVNLLKTESSLSITENQPEDETLTKQSSPNNEVVPENSGCKERVLVTTDLVKFPIDDADAFDELDAIWVFRYLLVFNACLESFAHGSNDTANATGAFSAVYQMYTNGGDCQKSDSEIWIMAVAGAFVALGVITLGYRVIRTIGIRLTLIDFHKGFYIEFASTFATMVATMQGVPVSTTHCQVGAVFAVGLYSKYTTNESVNSRLLSLIFFGWVITIPFAGGIAMGVVVLARNLLKSA